MVQRQTVFINRTPLPSSLSETVVVQTLHDHGAMIAQNPLVIHYERCPVPEDAPPDETDASWYELIDRIDYLPCGLLPGRIRYRACFRDTPQGLRTHVYAPMGVDIRNLWTVCMGEPGREDQAGLYLQEEVDLRCPLGTTSFVRRTLTNAHKELVERLAVAKSDAPRV